MNVAGFLARLEPAVASECVLWRGGANKDGYGLLRCWFIAGMPVVAYAHRVAYLLFREPFDLELTLDHLCRVKLCCNPYHLEVVTRIENIDRMNEHNGMPRDECGRFRISSEAWEEF